MFKVAVIAGNLELAEVIQSHKDDDVGKLQQNSEPMIKFKAVRAWIKLIIIGTLPWYRVSNSIFCKSHSDHYEGI